MVDRLIRTAPTAGSQGDAGPGQHAGGDRHGQQDLVFAGPGGGPGHRGGPQCVDQLATRLSTSGRRPLRPATIAGALEELHAAGLATVDVDDQGVTAGRWLAAPAARDPCWMPLTCTARTTSAIPTPPGWRTPASPPASLTS
jgi:hypothetical protein